MRVYASVCVRVRVRVDVASCCSQSSRAVGLHVFMPVARVQRHARVHLRALHLPKNVCSCIGARSTCKYMARAHNVLSSRAARANT